MSSNEARIQLILEEILDSDVSAEEACRDYPELLPEVAERLGRARAMEAHIDAVFPSGDLRGGGKTLRQLARRLPRIPGYQIEGVLGCGGVGVVYRARHLKLNRSVAVKMLLAGGYAGPQELERFKREAESIAALCHPNIVHVFDAGECDGHPYFVMEFVEGGNLSQQLDGRPRPPQEAAEQVTTLARAVHAAHSAGITHRDLKPANILLAADGTLKVADFGLAQRSDQAEAAIPLTIAGGHLGTPSYMSPEQAAGSVRGFCPLVDIYALGAILYELLTGRPPFRGESPAETVRQVLSDEPVRPSRLCPKVPRDLETICLKCLQKDPSRRYGSAADLADDLERFSRGDPIHARPIGIAERLVKWCRRRPGAAAACALSLAFIGATIAGVLWLQRVENVRHTQFVVRRDSARHAIESALPLLERLSHSRQWAEAAGVLNAARAQLNDAESPDIEARLSVAADLFQTAQELDRIRQNFPEAVESGYSFFGAREAYARLFTRIGIGSDVDVATAATRVLDSPLRDLLLSALDHAAFTELFGADHTEFRRLLAVARTAAPDPWQDRFRDPATWEDRDRLQSLVHDASSANPGPPVHQLTMVGLLLSKAGVYDVTITILREAQLRDPADFWVNLELGNALNRTGNRSDAIQFFRTAAALRPTHSVVWTTLGWTLLQSGRPDEAVAPLRKAVQLQPRYAAAWQNLISALADCGRWDEAQAACLDAVAAMPDNAAFSERADWIAVDRARAAAKSREWAVSRKYLRQALDGGCAKSSEAWFELAAIELLAGDVPEYRRVCSSMLDRCETAGLRKFLVARACTLAPIAEGELSRAASLGMQELDLHAHSHWSLTERGAILCREGRMEDAIRVLEESIQANGDPVNAVINWVWLAQANLKLGERDAARRWLAKASDWLDQAGGMPERIHLHNWLEAQVLRREVEAGLAP